MNESRSFLKTLGTNRQALVGLIGPLIIVILGLCAPLIAPYPEGYGADLFQAPSLVHLFGTDSLGLDVFGEVVWGCRTSLSVSLMAVSVAALIGIPAGLISGYAKGAIGAVIDGIVDIFLSLPVLPLMIVVAAIVGSSITNVAVIIGALSWPSLARVVRNATLKISEMPYIEAARSLGIPSRTIIFKHILANVTGPALVNLTLAMATAVLTESSLSFLGLGDPTAWSWGIILKHAWDTGAVLDIPNPWWWWFWPSLFITVFVVCFNLLGTNVNDALNPRVGE
jgi:peptide/nickel transport system permease protein